MRLFEGSIDSVFKFMFSLWVLSTSILSYFEDLHPPFILMVVVFDYNCVLYGSYSSVVLRMTVSGQSHRLYLRYRNLVLKLPKKVRLYNPSA